MRFSEEIKNCIGDFSAFSVLFSETGGYIVGVKKLVMYSSSAIELVTVRGKLKIMGANLVVGKYTDCDFSYFGKTISVELES